MKQFISEKSVVLAHYESRTTFSSEFYESGVFIKIEQKEVVKSKSKVKERLSLTTAILKNHEAIELRDHLIARYPIEAAK